MANREPDNQRTCRLGAIASGKLALFALYAILHVIFAGRWIVRGGEYTLIEWITLNRIILLPFLLTTAISVLITILFLLRIPLTFRFALPLIIFSFIVTIGYTIVFVVGAVIVSMGFFAGLGQFILDLTGNNFSSSAGDSPVGQEYGSYVTTPPPPW
ncbi:MAG: hypothetical protein ACYC6A_19885, partial [Armatimonadota bacterium]